ncbi:MAG: SDR family oxidoreductase [Anaerolineae bacterium]|nr:SDR family oxidoreductase [Anaerolineae bacterium]
MELTEKVALITGGAVRLGREMALGLADHGCNIVIHYHRSADEAHQTVSDIERRGVKGWAIPADFASDADLLSLIPTALQQAGRLDILVNSASIFPREDFFTTTAASWDQNMQVNLKAPFLLSQAFANALPKNQPSLIINLLDAIAMRPKNHHFAYTISKIGLEGLTKAMAYALAGKNIRVNGIALGTILPIDQHDQDIFDRLARKIPLQRTGSPEEVVKTLLYLVQAADYVTGEIIRLDGGKHLV